MAPNQNAGLTCIQSSRSEILSIHAMLLTGKVFLKENLMTLNFFRGKRKSTSRKVKTCFWDYMKKSYG